MVMRLTHSLFFVVLCLLAAGCGGVADQDLPLPVGSLYEDLQCTTTYRDQYHNTGTACGTTAHSSICGPTSAAMLRQTMTCGQCAPSPGAVREWYNVVAGLPVGSCASSTSNSAPGAFPGTLATTMMRVGTGKQFDDGCAAGTVLNHCTSSSVYTITALKSDLSPANGYVAVMSGDMSKVASHCCSCPGGAFYHTLFARTYDPATDKFEVWDPDATCNRNPQVHPSYWTSAEMNAFSNGTEVTGLCALVARGPQTQPGPCSGLADGYYCGGEHGMTGTSGVLYHCSGGSQTAIETCASWCAPTAKGDFCAPRHHVSRQVDVNGDGKADVCGRASDGVHCWLSNGTAFPTAVTVAPLSDANGWITPDSYTTFLWGDINGDGKADFCARASDGFYCWPSTGTAFGAKTTVLALSDASGWIAPQFRTTVQLADVNGDGKDDVCGRAAAGFTCWLSNGAGFPTSITASPAIMSDGLGWGSVQFYSTIQMADINGDGKADVCGRAGDGVHCYLSSGSNFTQAGAPIADFSDANGGNVPSVFSTIQLGDVNGDGKADLCGRLSSGFFCYLADGQGGFSTKITGPALSDSSGWNNPVYYATIQLGDVNGDGKADVCARASDRWHCWLSDGNGFPTAIDGPTAVSDASGWNKPQYDSTLQLGDIDGDGRADLCGRAGAGWWCWPSSGTGFSATQIVGPALSDSSGWDAPQYFATIELVGRTLPKVPVVVPGPDAGTPVRPDASAAGEDAQVALPGEDAQVALPGEDAQVALPGEDAQVALSGEDAGFQTGEDAEAAIVGDASTHGKDAGAPPARVDAGSGEATAGCGCGAGSQPVAWLALALVGALGLRRRRGATRPAGWSVSTPGPLRTS
jgi:MYXO-CTERM domain-containing protein